MVVFEPLYPGVAAPCRATELSAGYDIRAHLAGRRVRVRGAHDGDVTDVEVSPEVPALALAPGACALVPLGFRARLPSGYEAQLRMRSSVAFRKGLIMPNAPATIDADYPDEWLVMLQNAGAVTATIDHGERIAQIVLARVESLPWERGVVGVSTDRRGGLGSTGR